jgi:2-C-methyl-D-erythritol 4-phosphate cytidylyltransferase / 2-C-methyl-D-erythritol 2,4-cyclodiphosphate synthase
MVCAVIVAAGKSTRMGSGDKNMMMLAGKPVLRRCLEAFESCRDIEYICLVTAQERQGAIARVAGQWGITKLMSIVAGGDTRTMSVKHGLKALPPECEMVAIQDAARPFTTADIISRSINSARERGSGIAAIRSRDTVKTAGDNGLVLNTPDRRSLWLVQTPQTFCFEMIAGAYKKAEAEGFEATDDAAVAEWAGEQVYLVEGSVDNFKITTPEDILHAEAVAQVRDGIINMPRAGEGYDAHRLVGGRDLILGGVHIPHETGLLGHSDADVLLHAIMDALLGAAGMGDIGRHFPDTNEDYRGVSSLALLELVAGMIREQGYRTGNLDATIVAQRPKLAPYIPQMRENIARVLGISTGQINVKATTTEGMGFEGREEGISARAVAEIYFLGAHG